MSSKKKKFASLDLHCTADIAYAKWCRHAHMFLYPTFTAAEAQISHLSLL